MIDAQALHRRARYAGAHAQPVFITPEEWTEIWADLQHRIHGLEPLPSQPEPGSQLFGVEVQVAELAARDQTTSAQLWSEDLQHYPYLGATEARLLEDQ